MRIIQAFLVTMAVMILFLIPLSTAVYDYKTDLWEDAFNTVTTDNVSTTSNVTLFDSVYNDDTNTISISSNVTTEAPIYSSYNSTSRQLTVGGLATSTTRTLAVSYDVDALEGAGALAILVDRLDLIWLLMIIMFPVAGMAAIFTGRS